MAVVLTTGSVAVAAVVALAVLTRQEPVLAAAPWPGRAPGGWWSPPLVAAVLGVAGVLHLEAARAIERSGHPVGHEHASTSAGAWVFAAVLVLPPGWAVGVVVLLHACAWLRSRRVRTAMHLLVHRAASVVLGALAAVAALVALRGSAGLDPTRVPWGTPLAVLVAGVALSGVVHLLDAAPVAGGGPRWRWRRVSREDVVLEGTVLCIGALTAAVVAVNPALVLLVPAPLVLVTRAALVRELRRSLDLDGKTGLLTLAAWRARVERLLAIDPRRVERGRARVGATMTLGVLMCDIDHFKRVNDAFGHIVGDAVLRAVAEALKAAVRPTDLVARFGGEEFLIMLVMPGHVGETTGIVVHAAERIRARIAGLRIEVPRADVLPGGPCAGGALTIPRLTMSIGAVAVRATPGITRPLRVLDLVGAADAAVYAAKRAGRDQVRAT